MSAYRVTRFGETDFQITTADGRSELFEIYRRSRGTGDYLLIGGVGKWTKRGHTKLERLGLFEFNSGRPAPRVKTFLAEAVKDTKGKFHV